MSLAFVLGIVVLAVIAACVAILVARHLAPDGGFLGTPEPAHAASVLSPLGAGLAILIGFVLLLAFQDFLNAKRNADAEGRATAEQYVLSNYFPAPAGQRLGGELICYGRAVVFDEWPRMRQGWSSRLVDGWEAALARDVFALPVRSNKDAVIYGEWFDRRSVREQGRRERLQAAVPFVPPLLWLALIGGTSLLVAYVCLFANRRIGVWPQLAVVSVVAATGALNLSVVYFLDHPYRDVPGSIAPSAMRQTLAMIERQREHSLAAQAVPCDMKGRPVGAGTSGHR
jgi:hypothetical protein